MPSDLIRGWIPVRVKKTRQSKNALIQPAMPDRRAANFFAVLVRHQDRAVLSPQFRPDRIQFVGEAIRGVGCQHIVAEIETVMVQNGLLSNQIEMISRHVQRTPRLGECSVLVQRRCHSLVLRRESRYQRSSVIMKTRPVKVVPTVNDSTMMPTRIDGVIPVAMSPPTSAMIPRGSNRVTKKATASPMATPIVA